MKPRLMRSQDDVEGLRVAQALRQQLGKRQLGIDPKRVGDFPAFSAAAAAMKDGDFATAEEIGRDLVRRYGDPAHPEACYVLGLCAWWGRDDPATARDILAHVVTYRPDVPEYRYNLGLMTQKLGDDDEAARIYEGVLADQPDMAGALVNLGNARLAQGRVDDALACYERAARSPAYGGLATYNRAIAHFLRGEWAKGWADFEYRWENPAFLAKTAHPPLPDWTGDAPAGRSLLVFAEQGLGDTLMMWRYHARLAEMWAGRVTWLVQDPLACLLPGALPMGGDLPAADVCVAAMSLPHRLGMPEDGQAYLVPHLHPYVSPSGLQPRKVGTVYAGSPIHENDSRRSIDPAEFAALLEPMDGVEFVDLQVGRGGTFQPADWRETARVIAGLDLVITVDTSVAHLAGAMGVPVWILLDATHDYRWSLGQDTTVWYDSARLFRQRAKATWPEALARVRGELAAWVRA